MPPVHRFARLLLFAALLAPAGCFYTASINERPEARIDFVSTSPYFPDDPIVLSARSSDDEDSFLDCRWTSAVCPRGTGIAGCDPPFREQTQPCADVFEFELPGGDEEHGHLPVEVTLEVEDQDGAVASDVQTIRVGNRAPEIDIGVPPARTDHFVVTFPIAVDATVDDPDGDPDIELTWDLLRPRDASPDVKLVPVGESESVYQFTPDVAGTWTVEVVADDGLEEGSAVQRREIQVMPDQAPCIATASPAAVPERYVLRREDGPRAFSVLRVEDDLDPYPRPFDDADYLGEIAFAWQLASPDTGGELEPVTGATGADLTIDPAAFAPGELLDLRVEVADRVERVLPCEPDEPACDVDGGQCYQRLSWGVEIR
jgi:hypothetical protein